MRASTLAAIVLLLSIRAFADGGGEPLETDDPGTPGDRKWEINAGVTLEGVASHLQLGTPALDFNYGVGEHVQLKFETEANVITQPGSVRVGMGYSKIGVKWRFVDQEKSGVAVSIYPQVIFNSPVVPADGKTNAPLQLLIPAEVFKKIGKVELMGEAGIDIVSGEIARLLYGVALGYLVSDKIELLGEIHGLAPLDFHGNDELHARLGARVTLSQKLKLLLSAGHSLREPSGEGPEYLVYLGVQYTP